MDFGFREFCQTPRGRGFILLGFYTLFMCFVMFRMVLGLKQSFDRFQVLEPNSGNFETHWTVHDCSRTVLGC